MTHSSEIRIPFNKPSLVGNELAYIQQALEAGHISGDGTFTKKCHAFLERELGVPKALLTTSCTHALEMAALLLDIQPGDEVILPSFTFVSTINAFVLRGARPVFIDIRPDTMNMDEGKLAERVTPSTKAIIPVHYAGVSCEMEAILSLAAQHNLAVVEDNAHGLFARYRGNPLGSLGTFATQSFHETKNFTCGEGGALLINHPQYFERAEHIREKGTNRSQFFRGQVDKYTWVDIGSSYLPSEVLAGYLLAQFERKELIQDRRRQIWWTYHESLDELEMAGKIRRPIIPPHCEQSYHMYYLLTPTLEVRTGLIHFLRKRGILAIFHYQPLHLSHMGQRYGGRAGDCPVTESISDRLVRLPFYIELSNQEQADVVAGIYDFFEQAG